MPKSKPYFQVSTRKPVVIPLEKLHKDEVFFVEGEHLFKLSLFRPRGTFNLELVRAPETLIKMGFMEKPVEEPQELEESTKDLSSKLSTKLLRNVEEPEDEAV